MKTTKLVISFILLIFCAGNFVNAQTATYKHGTVWNVAFVKTKPNMETEYLNSLKSTWKAVMDEAVKQGLLVSYKILEGSAANPDDWNVMLMQEYKDYNSMGDVNMEKWDSVRKSVLGGDDKMKATNEARINVREIFGDKVVSEVIYK